MEKKTPIVAILYDFDKTLCTQDMQNYSFIPNLGMTPGEYRRKNTPDSITNGWFLQKWMFHVWKSPFRVYILR